MNEVLEITISPLLDTQESRRSGRIVRVLDRFMFLGEAVSNKHDLNSSNYNETISDKNLENWQSAMKVEDDIYMMEPYSFIAKGQEHMVCKLHRSIFGLNQTSQS